MTPSVDQHFTGTSAAVRATYDRLKQAAARFGDFSEDPKKTSIHLNRRTAFAGVAMRKDAIRLTIKADADIRSKRIVKRSHASTHRWHLEVMLTTPKDVDSELVSWLKRAYELSA
jgi:Domain of unknown function (DUF5655)